MDMKNILDQICEDMRVQVAEDKIATPLEELAKSPHYTRECYDFQASIKSGSGVIAEFKRKSPSKGFINADANLLEITTGYEKAGASAVSILTNGPYFGGKNEFVTEARAHLSIPILRKEFIVDSYQIHEAKAIGADLILLIAECLTKEEIVEFTACAHDLGLQVLMELHAEDQLEKIIPELDAVGINNRNLKTFEVDIERSIELAKKLPKDIIRIAESGLSDVATACRMQENGFSGFLVGEQFMKQNDPAAGCAEFVTGLK